MDTAVDLFLGLPPALLYALLGVGSALENLLPPIPADTFILLGGFLAGRGTLDPWIVFGITWGSNVLSALAIYGIGLRYGRSFFEAGAGRHVLHEGQLGRMRQFYRRWGHAAIFLTRFLPGLRAVVPAFAGVSHQPFLPVAVPLALASAIWYGLLVWIGASFGRNLSTLLGWLGDVNRVLLLLALVLAAAIGAWWYRTRRRREGGGRGKGEAVGDGET